MWNISSTNFCLEDAKRSVMDRAVIFFKNLYQNNRSLANGRSLMIDNFDTNSLKMSENGAEGCRFESC